MRLEEFMMYPDWVCRMALLPRYEWKGRQSPAEHYSLAKRMLLMLGIFHLVYHNIGCIMYAYHVDGTSKDPIRYVAELATVGSMLGFTIVGTLNLWKLLYFKPQIEEMLGDFEEFFKHVNVNVYRPKMYFEAYTRFLKGLVIVFCSSIVYYDSLPLTLMLWQHFMTESQELSYVIQSSTWYPWQIQGSVLGFSVAFILQTFSCQLLMASLMLSQYLVSFCGTQLQIHFDGLARQLEAIDARHPTAKDQLRYLVTYQSHLFKLADKVNHIFNFTFCVSLLTATIGMCFLAFSMTMFEVGEALKHLLGLTIFMIYNFTMSRDGTHLTYAVSLRE
ncbi:putative odorant receptor 69a [Drosophila serrata]|uniref:putative odorant receptor 69a n=1 Tax=Drosophila serrata TaxID=7274 RepID=UPI000A1D0517|nr:putative odorant receptor 69a [Drosophila serrata]